MILFKLYAIAVAAILLVHSSPSIHPTYIVYKRIYTFTKNKITKKIPTSLYFKVKK